MANNPLEDMVREELAKVKNESKLQAIRDSYAIAQVLTSEILHGTTIQKCPSTEEVAKYLLDLARKIRPSLQEDYESALGVGSNANPKVS